MVLESIQAFPFIFSSSSSGSLSSSPSSSGSSRLSLSTSSAESYSDASSSPWSSPPSSAKTHAFFASPYHAVDTLLPPPKVSQPETTAATPPRSLTLDFFSAPVGTPTPPPSLPPSRTPSQHSSVNSKSSLPPLSRLFPSRYRAKPNRHEFDEEVNFDSLSNDRTSSRRRFLNIDTESDHCAPHSAKSGSLPSPLHLGPSSPLPVPGTAGAFTLNISRSPDDHDGDGIDSGYLPMHVRDDTRDTSQCAVILEAGMELTCQPVGDDNVSPSSIEHGQITKLRLVRALGYGSFSNVWLAKAPAAFHQTTAHDSTSASDGIVQTEAISLVHAQDIGRQASTPTLSLDDYSGALIAVKMTPWTSTRYRDGRHSGRDSNRDGNELAEESFENEAKVLKYLSSHADVHPSLPRLLSTLLLSPPSGAMSKDKFSHTSDTRSSLLSPDIGVPLQSNSLLSSASSYLSPRSALSTLPSIDPLSPANSNEYSYSSSPFSTSGSSPTSLIPTSRALLLPFTPGGDLLELVNSDARHALITESLVKAIWSELSGAVAWLHKRGVVHRDVKLENILLTQSPFPSDSSFDAPPQGPLIHLTDFGLARIVESDRHGRDSSLSSLRVSGSPVYPYFHHMNGFSEDLPEDNPFLFTSRCGSDSYLAPEMVVSIGSYSTSHLRHMPSNASFASNASSIVSNISHGSSASTYYRNNTSRTAYDARKTDAWACGVVLYALVTRSLPFGEEVTEPVYYDRGSSWDARSAYSGRSSSDGREKRRAWLAKIARGEWSWPASSIDSESREGTSDGELRGARLAESVWARGVVERLLVREPEKRAWIWDCDA